MALAIPQGLPFFFNLRKTFDQQRVFVARQDASPFDSTLVLCFLQDFLVEVVFSKNLENSRPHSLLKNCLVVLVL